MSALTLLLELRLLVLSLLLTLCVLVALFSRSESRRQMAMDLALLFLTPSWRRGASGRRGRRRALRSQDDVDSQ